MGLIRIAKDVIGAGFDSLNGALESGLWKEYFTSGDMSSSVLMKRAEKVVIGKGKNTKSDDNLISSGSGIDVQENQCMIIVDNGAIVEFCAEPGRYTYNASSQPSLYAGENKGLKSFGKEILNQWSAGGQRFSTQRVYFINMGQIYDPILWGLGNVTFIHSFQPVPTMNPIRKNVTLKAHGTIKTRIENPVDFYKEIGAQKAGGDNDGLITIASLGDSLFKSLKSAISNAISTSISKLGRENVVSYAEIMAFSDVISEYVTERMQEHSLVKAGFAFYEFYIEGSPELTEKDYEDISEMENKYNMASNMAVANYDIQKTFAKGFENAGQNGGVSSIMGMGMAMGGGGFGNFGQFQQQAPQQPVQPQPVAPVVHTATQVISSQNSKDTWICECGHTNTGKFCMECGSPKPLKEDSIWVCHCGTENTGKFCMECGSKKPEPKKKLVCDKCGWTAPEGTEKVKFCPECGDIVTEVDYK